MALPLIFEGEMFEEPCHYFDLYLGIRRVEGELKGSEMKWVISASIVPILINFREREITFVTTITMEFNQ